MFTWEFTPDAADIAACKGACFPVLGDGSYKTESLAIWHGKKWLKSTTRTGIITAVLARQKPASYILDI